jgi:hypothetical protein
MRLTLLAAATAIAGCQSIGAPEYSRYARDCPDRPADAGFCEQPTNWRLFDPVRWGAVVVVP